MRNLVFIRHSQSQPDPKIPSSQWSLTREGRRRCEPLAEQLIPYELDIIITSSEPKAIETGELIAQRLAIPYQVMKKLHEHERETVPFFGTKDEFQKAVSTLFTKPDKLIFGEETGLEARDRFLGAVESVLAAYPQENIAIVTHGTVLSLFAYQFVGQEAIKFWRNLGMPAFVVFSHPEMKLLAQMNVII